MSELFYENLGINGEPFIALKNTYYSLKDYEHYFYRLKEYLDKTKVQAEWEPAGYLIRIAKQKLSLKGLKKSDVSIKDRNGNRLTLLELYRVQNLLLLNDNSTTDTITISFSDKKRKSLTCSYNRVAREEIPAVLEKEARVWVELLGSDDTGDLLDQFFESGLKQVSSEGRNITIIEQDYKEKRLCLESVPSGKDISIRPNTFVVRKQLEAVKALQDAPNKAHTPLINLFEPPDFIRWETAKAESVSSWYCLTDSNRPGTDEQRKFVEQALGTPDYCILDGPPGSGKTTAIIELIHQLAAKGMKVLLAASTHVAVDNVIERLKMDRKNKNHVFLVRIGNEGRVSESIIPYCYQRMAATEEKKIVEGLEKNRNKRPSQKLLLNFLRGENGKKEIEALILRAAHLVCGTTIGILQHPAIKHGSGIKEPLFDYLILDEASKTPFAEFLVPGLLAKKWIIAGDRRQLSPYVEEKGIEQNIEAALWRRKKEDDKKNIQKIVFALFCLWKNNKEIMLVQEDNRGIQALYRAQALKLFGNKKKVVILDDLEVAENSLEHGLFLVSSRIIIGSLEMIRRFVSVLPLEIALFSCTKQNDFVKKIMRQRDAVCKKRDSVGNMFRIKKSEQHLAGQMSWRIIRDYELRLMPELLDGIEGKSKYEDDINNLLPAKELLQGRGDGIQRKQKLTDDIASIKRVALPSILEILQCGAGIKKQNYTKVIDTGIPEQYLQSRLITLSYQHRMHPQISRFPRKHFYKESALKDPEDMAEKRAWPLTEYQFRALWINVIEGNMDKTVNKNEPEAETIMRKLKELNEKLKQTPHPARQPWTIGILTFYSAQEYLLRQKLRDYTHQYNKRIFTFKRSEMPYLKVELCTVDRFQGHEADIIMLSLVRTKKTGFLDSPHRLNVAITRARYQLLIFGKRNFFINEKNHKAVFLRKLAHEIPEIDDLGTRR